MSKTPDISLVAMDQAEIPGLTRLMAAAFDADAPCDCGFDRHLLDCYHCSDFFHQWPPGCLDAEQYTVRAADDIAGGVVIWHFAADDAVLGLLFVAPNYQHKGVGRRIWHLLEAQYQETARWLVAAPRWSPHTQQFYEQQCGFQHVRTSGDYVIYGRGEQPRD